VTVVCSSRSGMRTQHLIGPFIIYIICMYVPTAVGKLHDRERSLLRNNANRPLLEHT
jgi:hypothetical protein